MEFEWQNERGEDACSLGISAMDMPEEGGEDVPIPYSALVMEENVTHQTLSGGSSMEDDSDPEHEQEDEHAGMRIETMGVVDPEPHLSTQFYTFNKESHQLMVQCLLHSRYATPYEIRGATSPSVLASWRGVWKDRNEDTAYLTGWKRIQDKLVARLSEESGSEILTFKNNPNQCVPHINQWQDIAMAFHADADFRHLSLKDTIEKIKQVWTVGAKFYGIPESFIRVCINSCPVCSSDAALAQPRSKRRRFEYTESFEIPSKEVPQRLQQLAAKHKVVLCIRQKYIRYKPFMAEVKDYCCHRAGAPNAKKPGVLKRKRYSSKRCGCGFRIRAIVPIKDYNQRDKTFTYEDDGMAVFKLYAVHSGHEPGPHEGSARIIHRFVGPANSAIEQGTVQINEECNDFAVVVREPEPDLDLRITALKQLEELKMELGCLEDKISAMGENVLLLLSSELCAFTHRLRNVGNTIIPQNSDEVFLTGPAGLDDWGEDNKDTEQAGMIGEEEGNANSNFRHAGLDSVRHSQRRRPGRPPKRKTARDDNIINNHASSSLDICPWPLAAKESYDQFDDKSILVCKDTKAGIRHDDTIVEDGHLVGLHVDGYYQDNIKWYEGMSCSLDPSADCGDNLAHAAAQEGFRHAIV